MLIREGSGYRFSPPYSRDCRTEAPLPWRGINELAPLKDVGGNEINNGERLGEDQ